MWKNCFFFLVKWKETANCCKWQVLQLGNVISGVLQGSVLGLLLFLIYINDIDIDLCSKLYKFADDTKIGHAVAIEEEVQLSRADFKNLAK